MAMTVAEKLARRTKKNLLGEKKGIAESTGFIDTGSYTLNLLASGSPFGGIPNNSFTGLAGESTTGKAQPLYSKVKTPFGWKNIGDIVVGDLITCPDGSTTDVIGLFPQGNKKIYEIEFRDGRKVRCCDEHLWAITTKWPRGGTKNGKKKKYFTNEVISLKTILSKSENQIRSVGIPLIMPVLQKDKELSIHPYLMGILIGDGSLTGSKIGFSTSDMEIVSRITQLGYSVYQNSKYDYTVHDLMEQIRSFDLQKKSPDKHIPFEYLEGTSYNQKLELIRGLIDSDGYVDKNGSLSYCTTSKRLMNDIVYLFRSIGGKVGVSFKEKNWYTDSEGNKKLGLPSWILYINHPDKKQFAFLTRKKSLIKTTKNDLSNLKFKNIRYIGEEKCVCIAVNHASRLYITDDFVVTHNTYFALGMCKHFMQNEKALTVLADTEAAVREETATSRGIDAMRIIQMEPICVEDFRTDMLQMMEDYGEIVIDERPPLLAVLDSLGNLSTRKELEDTATFGDSKEALKRRETKDMTRAGLLRGSFRVLRLKMARLGVPMIITNHVYANIGGYGASQVMSGGGGLKYAADTIWFLSKAKAKEDDAKDGKVIGAKITVRAIKSRLARENAEVEVLLDYDRGLDRYYGLTDIAIEAGVLKKLTKGLEMPDGTAVARKALLREPEKYFTDEILKQIEEAAAPIFKYGQVGKTFVEPENESDEE